MGDLAQPIPNKFGAVLLIRERGHSEEEAVKGAGSWVRAVGIAAHGSSQVPYWYDAGDISGGVHGEDERPMGSTAVDTGAQGRRFWVTIRRNGEWLSVGAVSAEG